MTALSGKRILVVEDEPIVAMTLEDMLLDLGCEVIGPAMRLDQALALAGGEPLDAAILDVNINGGRSYPVADALRRRSVPFMFATGYGIEGLEGRDAAVPTLQKPYRYEQVEAALRDLIAHSNVRGS